VEGAEADAGKEINHEEREKKRELGVYYHRKKR